MTKANTFVPKMRAIFQKYDVDVVNVSIRHALPDPGSYLAWARNEVFAFVIYHSQGTTNEDREEVATWTRAMTDAIISENGTYYLPYQPHATVKQFRAGTEDNKCHSGSGCVRRSSTQFITRLTALHGATGKRATTFAS